MDLVRDEDEIPADADFAQPLELLPRPDAADRIVGIAEDEHTGLRIDFPFEVLEIHDPAAAFTAQGIADEAAAVVFDGRVEGMIDRRLDDDPFAGAGERLNAEVDRRNDAGGLRQPLAPDVPPMAVLQPADGGIPVGGRMAGVVVNRMFCPLSDGFGHGRRTGKIHVGYPHRDDFLQSITAFADIPLQGSGVPPLGSGVKIVFHTLSAVPPSGSARRAVPSFLEE